MVPLVRHENEDLSYSSFLKLLKESASNAYENKQIFCNCLLIFDETHPEMVKLLRDREYYASLNSVSGRWINVFHAGVKIGNKEPRLLLDHRESQYREIIQNLRSEFLENQNPKNPLVFFFYVKNDEIAETIVFKISDGSTQEMYQELRQLLERVKSSIQDVEAENASNYEVIFDLQRIGVDAVKTITFVKKIQKLPILGFLGLLKRVL
jgi:hypothetical protein